MVLDLHILLVAEGVSRRQVEQVVSDQLEFTTEMRDAVVRGLQRCVKQVSTIENASELIDRLPLGTSTLAFPYGYGRGAMNRVGHATAICEAKGLPYIGCDSYSRLLSHDKTLSKKLAEEIGFPTPRGYRIRRIEDLALASRFQSAMIAKPNSDTGSRFIDRDSIAIHPLSLEGRVAEILDSGDDALLEEFIDAEDISICLLRSGPTQMLWSVVKRRVDTNTPYSVMNPPIDYSVWHGGTKLFVEPFDKLPSSVIESAKRLLHTLAKCEYMRVDGRFDGETFYFIEMTPDPTLGPEDTFCQSFILLGMQYEEILRIIIQSSGRH